ncbi:MAG TPA: hypothetical protein VGS28_02225, partial [Candidatus Saccharimonadales bacterium]|nr:hypothetical protein [Candidatus Saccharimonadales bacterium]
HEATQFPPLQTLITEVRYLQQGLGTRDLELQFTDNPLLGEQKTLVDKLAHVSLSETSSPQGMHVAHPTIATWLVVDEKTLETHKERLINRLKDVEARITNLELRLKNDRYVKQAPKEIVAQTRSQLKEEQELHDRLTVEIKAFTA